MASAKREKICNPYHGESKAAEKRGKLKPVVSAKRDLSFFVAAHEE